MHHAREHTRQRLLGLAAMTASVLLVAACGDANDELATDPTGREQPADEAPTEDADNDQAGEDTGTDEATSQDEDTDPAPDAGTEGGASVSMEELMAAADGATIRIVYEVSVAQTPPVEMTMTSAFDGDRWSIRSAHGDMTSFIVGDDDTVVTCMQMGEWLCFEGNQAGLDPRDDIPGGETLLDDPAASFEGWTYVGDEQILGRDAACGTSEDAEVCFDRATGQPLRVVGDGMEMVAVEVGAPGAEDFELPAEPSTGFPG